MNNVAFIPVRGGSTSIPLKNVKLMCGKPLVYWTAFAAAQSDYVESVYVATDSDKIREIVNSLGIPKVKVIGRSPETATSTASSESALLEFAENYIFDKVVFIQATSPLLSKEDIDRAFRLVESGECDSVLSVTKDKRFYWREGVNGAEPVNYDVFKRPRRQDFDGWFQENGALYLTFRDALLQSRKRVSGRIGLLEMSPETGYEIDEPEDWIIIESLLKRKIRSEEITSLNDIAFTSRIKMVLTDCDGCLTDGGMYYGEDGSELKKFNTRDGMGFQLLRQAGIKTGVITGENSEAARRRAGKLKADYLEIGCSNKLAAVRKICEIEGITMEEVAYLGDDLNDCELMKEVGLSFAPQSATKAVREIAHYVLESSGGEGAFREIVSVLGVER